MNLIPSSGGRPNGDPHAPLHIGTIAKFSDCVWRSHDGATLPRRLLAVGFATANVRWSEGRPTETIREIDGDEPLPDVDDLNARIPETKWEIGLNGQPRPPWERQHAVFLLDPEAGGRVTYASSAIGARIAINDLRDRVETMSSLRGIEALPLVELAARPFKTRFGLRTRPHFEVRDWLTPSGSKIATPPLTRLPSPSRAEDIDDEIPSFDD